MRFDTNLILFLISFVTLAILHRLALIHFLYWVFPWFDIPMHILGGVVVALGSQTVLFGRIVPLRIDGVWTTLILVLFVGIAWEIFEWYFVLVDSVGYIKDTSLDMVCDLCGGAIGFFVASSFKKYF